MPRTTSSTVQNATAREDTKPIHLIRMAWATEQRIATYAVDITWNSEVWSASGASVQGVGADGGLLLLPNGSDDPWLALLDSEVARGRAITIYEYHTDFDASPIVSDAEPIFVGEMDEENVTVNGIQIQLIESRQAKFFPATSIGPPTYNFLLPKGARLHYGNDIVTVN